MTDDPMSDEPIYQPLAGVRVLDLTGQYAGSQITRILADLGAEVNKVEAARHIDMVSRGLVPTDNLPTNHWWTRAAYWAERNINKRGITIDLTQDEGKEVFYDLLDVSDIIAENYTPRVMRHFGFEYEQLKARKPGLIHVSLSGYGQEGPLANAPANAFGMLAAAGLAYAMGEPGPDPYLPTTSLADMYAGISTVGSILVALRRVRLTGLGERIDMAGREGGMPMAASFVVGSQLPPEQPGERVYSTVILACAGEEEWLVVCYRDADEWAQLCAVLGIADPPAPPADPDDPPEEVVRAAAAADRHEAAAALQAAGVAAAPVQTGRDILLDPHFEERDVYAVCRHPDPEIGARPFGRAFPVRVLGARGAELRDPPRDLGRDNREVFGEVLGYSEERIDALYEAGIAAEQPSTRFGRAWATPIDTEAMIHDGGALPAPDYLEVLSERFGERIGPTRWPEEGT